MNEPGHALTRRFPKGTVLFDENDLGSRMYVIRKGRVKIYRRVNNQEVVLAMLDAGDFFGEMALLENLPRSAAAQTTEDSELIEVDQQTFQEMIRNNAEIGIRVMRKLASRVRELDRRLQNLLVESGLGRAVEVLRWLHPTGVAVDEMARVPASKVAIAIAAQAGIPADEVEVVIARLNTAGCITEDGGDYLIGSVDTLRDYSEFLDLKRKYDPPTSVDATAAKPDVTTSVQRLLRALQIDPADERTQQRALAAQYNRYLELRRRFEGSGTEV
ncbi:MAG: cyclic nucleotide-binding domain-containing protein [Myxococcota bacterium]